MVATKIAATVLFMAKNGLTIQVTLSVAELLFGADYRLSWIDDELKTTLMWLNFFFEKLLTQLRDFKNYHHTFLKIASL